MAKSPFGTLIDPNYYEENEDIQDLHSDLDDQLREADYDASLFGYLSECDESDSIGTHSAGTQQPSTRDKGTNAKEALNKSPHPSWRQIFRLASLKNLEIHKVFLRFFASQRMKICSPTRAR